ncbi:hypothetical protein OG520_22120 [Streptomyces sp. NBC_00984]|uniref:hypothetical protein n=1 Tax=Streptomyces sp. NBC_00984 TaxID=2903700 RepID=UPI0038696328|nr:hypothetical protein OG520_22120 [Streptomyces sp. NBC_00984]
MAFPEDPLGLRAELLLAGAWTDITPDLYTREPVQITHGTASEGAQPDPASCSLLLNNRTGRYSPRNPSSPYFGLLGRNTPCRVSISGAEAYLDLDGTSDAYARTPDAAPLDITGDIDIRVEATTDWNAAGSHALIGKWISATNQRSYLLRLTDGLLILNWSPDGASTYFAQQPLPALPPRAALRATLDVNNGQGGFTATLWWAPTMDGPWELIGAPMPVSPATTIYAGTAPLDLAPSTAAGVEPIAGRIHRAEVRAGIGGTVVAAPDFRALADGATGMTDSAGCVWTLGAAAEVTHRQGIFHGEVSEWPPRWSASEQDAWVPVQAAGILRRLGQGRRPLQSTLRRRIPSAPGLLAYWPMEDGEGATQLYSPIDGVQPMKVSGLDLAADDSLPGSAALPTLGDVATLSARVPAAPGPGWHVEMVYRLPTMPGLQTEILRVAVTGSQARTVHVFASTSGIRLEARDSNGDMLAFIVFTEAASLTDFVGVWNRLAIFVSDNGAAGTRLVCAWRDIADGKWWYATTSYAGAMGSVTAVTGSWTSGGTQGMTIGHLSVAAVPGTGTTPGTTIYNGADRAFARETAVQRLVRLAGEEPQLMLSTRDGDATATSEQMGPQGQAELMTLVSEVVETDGGILYEQMDRLGLVYRDRATLYNQRPALTLDYAAGQVAPPLEPVDDDAELRNDVTVTRQGGSSGRAVIESGPLSVLPPEQGGVGVYEEAVTLSLGNDDQPYRIAGWRAHLGTWDEARYPTVRIRLHRHPDLIPAALGLRPGDLLRITNPPHFTGPGPLDLLVRQIQHQPLPRTWEVTLSCTPAGPYRIGVMDDPVLSRADTDGSAVSGDFSASDTLIRVATPAGPVWTQDRAELPFDIRAGGEVMTVTDIVGIRGDRFDRSVTNGWGTATSGQTWTTTGGAASDYSVQGG